MNRGVRSGLTPTVWRSFKPRLVTVNANADGSGLTQPVLDPVDGRYYQTGRYMLLRGVVFTQIQVQFIGSGTVGVGSAYAFSLPVPARRATPGAADPNCIGNAMCYWSLTSPFANVPCSVTVCDPWASLQGSEDDYCQLIAPEVVAWGTLSGAGAQSANHGLGFTPPASSVVVTPTSATGSPTLSFLPPKITTSSTQVTVDPFGSPGTWNASWKVRADPPTGQGGNYVGPQVPFDWDRFDPNFGPFGNIFITATYEPR